MMALWQLNTWRPWQEVRALVLLCVSVSGAAAQTVIANSQLQTCIASGSVRAITAAVPSAALTEAGMLLVSLFAHVANP